MLTNQKLTLFNSEILVSRMFYKSGDSFKKGPLVFFHNMQEYSAHAEKNGWSGALASLESWCPQPIATTVFLSIEDRKRFVGGGRLTEDKAYFPGHRTEHLSRIGETELAAMNAS